MTDTTTRDKIRVSTDGTAGPYIMAPVAQLDAIRRLLDTNGIPYWVEENVISFDGSPEIGVVNLGRGGKALVVQTLLDTIH